MQFLDPMDIDQIPSSQSTQKIIQAMQNCEKYNSTADASSYKFDIWLSEELTGC